MSVPLRFETLACFDVHGERIALGEASMAMVRFSRALSEDEWRSFAETCSDFASVDTHAKRGDSTQIEAPSPMGSAVGEAETPPRSRQSNKPGREM